MTAAPKIFVHGHRGARAAMPENTIPAFEYALAQGVDALELDLAVTKDNVLVVSHDPEMNSKICKGPEGLPRTIRQLTLAQVKQFDCGSLQNPEFPKQKTVPGTRIPTFAEVLKLAKKHKVDLNVETKIFPAKPELTPSPEEFAKLVLDEVRKHKLTSRLILQSFDWRTLNAAKKLDPKVRLSALHPTDMSDAARKRDYVSEAKAAGYGIVSPHFRLTTKADVARAHSLGLQVVPWTANEPKIWDALIEAEVDAIISDDPAALIAYLKQKGLR
ncbi:MAG: glycerophosphodiester phosphodiesterase [Acidobacteria bacterium]|nr:glycerophosphodiester phosphodiesterase [Acidobacteriota bacterium]